MAERKKVGLITDNDFTFMHEPPFPKPSFVSFENPNRIINIFRELKKRRILYRTDIIKLLPLKITIADLLLGHSRYHIDSIKRLSQLGGGIIAEDVFITRNTFRVAKKAVGGAVQALKTIIEGDLHRTFAIIRPPGHHATKESASGLCVFNNIAIAIMYLRNILNFSGKIAIVDIDDHFGDGLARYFYADPSVLYFSIHEFDYQNADLGLINELGEGLGKGTNINYPLPSSIIGSEFMSMFEILEPILKEFQPELIIVATGFDMYFADPIGNCYLTSKVYHQFSKKMIELSEILCEGKISFILEGGYSEIGLPYCVLAIIRALLDEDHQIPEFEDFPVSKNLREEVKKIRNTLLTLLAPYWKTIELRK